MAMLPAILLFGGLLKASGEHAPCTWNATETEPCYLQIGGIFEYHDGMYDDDDNVRMNLPENDCSGHDPIPYIEAVNGLNGGRGFMVHSSGLEVAQSRPYPRYYYRLNFTRRSFRKGNWTHGDALGRQLFPGWSFILGMGSGCRDDFITEQAKLANEVGRIWMTARGPWSQISEATSAATGIPLKWGFSSHVDSRSYAAGAIRQFALRDAKTARVIYFSGGNLFLRGVGEGALKLLEESGLEVEAQPMEQLRPSSSAEEREVWERAIDEAIDAKVDVIITSSGRAGLELILRKLESRCQEHVPKGMWAPNVVWGTSGIKCLGLGELCAHVLSSTQPGALYQVAGELRDGVLNLTAGEFRKTDNDKDTEDAVEKNYEMDTAVSAFIQAVQGVYRFREIQDPRNLLHSEADRSVYVAVRDFMLSGEIFGDTFQGPARFSPLGQINGMEAPTARMSDPANMSILFPTEYAEVGFEYPVPAALACPANFYKWWREDNDTWPLDQAECLPCPENSERVEENMSSCSCSKGYYADILGCQPCPEGAVCSERGAELQDLILEPGYWRYGNTTSDVYECKPADSCLGGVLFGDESCNMGHEGLRCEVCAEGYYKDFSSSECQACPDVAAQFGLAQLLAIVFLCLVFLLICFRKQIRELADRIVTNAKAKKKDLKTQVKIFVSLLQVMNMLPGIFSDVVWPQAFRDFAHGVGIFNLSLEIVPLSCIRTTTFYDRLLVTTCLPIALVLVLAVSCMIHGRFAADRARLQSSYFGACLFLTYLVFPFAVNTIFATFRCESFDLGGGQSGSFLAVDLSLDCDAEAYRHYHAFALFMVLVYPVGIPAWIAASVWRHRSAICPTVSPQQVSQAQRVVDAEKKGLAGNLSPSRLLSKLSKTDDTEGPTGLVSQEGVLWARMMKREEDPEIQHLKFIFEDYRPNAMYYEVFECFRKVFLTAVLVFVAPGSWLQIVIGICFCLICLKVLLYFQPYSNPGAAVSAELSQWILLLTLLLALLLFTAENVSLDIVGLDPGLLSQVSSIVLMVGTVLTIIAGIGHVVMELQFRKRTKESESQQLESETQSGSGADVVVGEDLLRC